MYTEIDRQNTRKAMAFDLMCIIEDMPKETFTPKELEKLIFEYVNAENKK